MNAEDTLHAVMAEREEPGVLTDLPPEWAEKIAESLREIAADRPRFEADLVPPERPPGAIIPLEDPALLRYRTSQGERAKNAAGPRLFRGAPSC